MRWHAGVDGGGSGTRARLQDAGGRTLGEGQAGPSSLSQGTAQAWRHVQLALEQAFVAAGLPVAAPGDIAIGLGLAGAGVAAQRQAFLQADPGHAAIALANDGLTQLLGAHAGRAGIVLAAGTGSVAMARYANGALRQTGGWGFPVGDEGSGAWLGLHAMQHAQAAADGRAQVGVLARAVWAVCGADAPALLAWCAKAGQQLYATLAPLVFDAANGGDTLAEALLQAAANDLGRLVIALQTATEPLPVAVRGSIGERLLPRWPPALRATVVSPAGDSADGALRLLRESLAAR